MKKILITFILIISTIISFAQDVIATAGSNASGTGIELSWTIGEPVTATTYGSGFILTQGFHQEQPAILGDTDVYPISSATLSRRSMPFTFLEDGDIQSISIYHNGGTGNVLLGVYSDNSGSPGSLLGVSPSTSVNGSEGWQTVSLSSSVSVNSGETVWLAWVFSTYVQTRRISASGFRYSSETWSEGMPATFGSSTSGYSRFSVYCTYSTGDVPPVILEVSPETVLLTSDSGAEGTFDIVSNTDWDITYDSDWLDVSPVSGSNDGMITITASSINMGTTSREAIITITGTDVSDKIVTVTQEGSSPLTLKDLGDTDVYPISSATLSRRSMPFTFLEDGDIQSISIYHNGGTGNVLLGVYSDNSGSPGSLLGVSPSTSVNGSEGWQTVSLSSSVSVNSGETVWLAWVFSTYVQTRRISASGFRYSSETWSEGMPATFGSSTSGYSRFSVYCTYIPDETKSAEITTKVQPDLKFDEIKVYPNPFVDKLFFEFTLVEDTYAVLEIYNLGGQSIVRLLDQRVEGGVMNRIEYAPSGIISGVYIYRLTQDKNVTEGKVIYNKQ